MIYGSVNDHDLLFYRDRLILLEDLHQLLAVIQPRLGIHIHVGTEL